MYDEFNPEDKNKNFVQKKNINLKFPDGESAIEEPEKDDMFIEIRIPEKADEESSIFLYF